MIPRATGLAPTSMTHRQSSGVTGRQALKHDIAKIPRFPAIPMALETIGRAPRDRAIYEGMADLLAID